MIKKLLAFGCSNTFGSECVQDGDHVNPENVFHSYPKFLSDMLGCTEYTNHAFPGKSNGDIAHDIYKFVGYELNKYPERAQEIFVVVGWSEANRYPFWFNIDGSALKEKTITEYILLSIFNPDLFKTFGHTHEQPVISDVKDILRKYPFAEQFMRGVMLYFFNSPSLLTYNLLIKAGISNFLENHSIKFITFPTLASTPVVQDSAFLGDKDPRVQEQILLNKQYNVLEWKPAEWPNQTPGGGDWTHNFNMFTKFTRYGISKAQGHLKPAAHLKLAEFLYTEIKKNNII